MLKGIIRGNIVSTRKQESLVGSKFMEVQLIKNGEYTNEYIIAIDSVGAGIGETVLITTGSSARLALHNTSSPADAVIVGIVELSEGCIIANRHIHMSPSEAEVFGLSDGDYVDIDVNGARRTRWFDVQVRVHKDFRLEMHVDTDDANAAGIGNGFMAEIVK